MKKPMRALAGALLALAAAIPAPASAKSPEAKLAPGFAWGAGIGGAIDMTGNDMSTVNIDACFGYRRGIVDFAGLGAGINIMVSNSSRAFPVYALLRTNFLNRPSLCFLDARLGCVFNNLADNISQTSLYASPGLGINLAGGSKFRSSLIVSYVYNGMSPFTDADGNLHDMRHGLHQACVRLAIAF